MPLNLTTKPIPVLLAVVAGFCVVAVARAAPSVSSTVEAPWDAGGTLFWSSDSGQTLTRGAGFDFDGSSVAQANALVHGTTVDSDTAFAFDWADTHAEASFQGAAGQVLGDGVTSDTAMVAAARATATAAGEMSASGYAAHAGRFTVHGGPGVITFSFPYTYTITVARDNGEQAVYGYARPTFSLDNYGPEPALNPRPYVPLSSVYDYGTSHVFGFGPGGATLTGTLSDSGLMSLSLFFSDGDKGHFGIGFQTEASAYAPTAPIPLPGSGLLLVSGVVALGMRRQRAINQPPSASPPPV